MVPNRVDGRRWRISGDLCFRDYPTREMQLRWCRNLAPGAEKGCADTLTEKWRGESKLQSTTSSASMIKDLLMIPT